VQPQPRSSAQRIALERQLARLPAGLAYQVRTTALNLSLRSIFTHLPEPLSLRVCVGAHSAQLPLTVRQLLKAAMISDCLRPVEVVTIAGQGVQVTLSRDAMPPLTLTVTQLQGGLQALLAALLGQLYDAEHFSDQLQEFALHSAQLSALRLFSIHMLRVRELPSLHYLLLSGLTSGLSLGFNRAALFLPTEAQGEAQEGARAFVGARAIGEVHTPEAFRIWERLELDERPLEELLQSEPQSLMGSPFERMVQRLTLTPTDAPGDEVMAALTFQRAQRFEAAAIVNPSLKALKMRASFTLAALRAPDRLLGLLLVDNHHTGAPIQDHHLYYMAMFLSQATLIWQNIELHDRIEHQSRHDPLTDALNRRGFDEVFRVALAQCRASAEPLCLMAFDLDDFKKINDDHGHDAGDEALRHLTQVLRARCRQGDALARFGGDEFILMLPGCGVEDAARLAERVGVEAHGVGLKLSVGVSFWPSDGDDPSRLLTVADQRLYAAKRAQRVERG
jgi:diguanylate cyclase (GGDEF)-like protein